MKNKIGRNDKCPCNSGKKYKLCHMIKNEKLTIEKEIASIFQKTKQQGYGIPITAKKNKDVTEITVGGKKYKGKWKTFHDFLFQYLQIIFGADWGNLEIKKPEHEKHPLIKIYQKSCEHQKKFVKMPGKINSAPFNGADSVYLWLSYNLYLIAHNSELQDRLIDRLKHPDQFAGAYYETYVAAILIKSGFEIEYEDESDRSKSHHEFIAKHKRTGKKYAIEAKFRHRKNLICEGDFTENFKLDIGGLLHDALEKKTDYEKIIFIDIDIPISQINEYTPKSLNKNLKMREGDIIAGELMPPAYIIVTNHPYHYDLESLSQNPFYMAYGFRIADFGTDEYITVDEIFRRYKKHKYMYEIFDSIKQHIFIPSTFDGSIPEFEFSGNKDRLIIGNKYLVDNANGEKIEVELMHTDVSEKEEVAVALCIDQYGKTHIINFGLSDSELLAYRDNPKTFFGVISHNEKNLNHPLEYFHFFMKAYSKLTKSQLLNKLKFIAEYQTIAKKSQQALLEIYCEHLVKVVLATMKK